MQVLNMLPFKEAVLVAVAAASAVTIILGLILFRRGKGKVTEPVQGDKRSMGKPAAAATSDYVQDEKIIKELNAITVALASTLNRLDTAVERCLELVERLPVEGSERGGVRLVHSPEPRPDVMKERIEKLRISGAVEEEIAETLNLSREQLQLYMHAGRKGEKEVVLQ